MLCVHLKTRVFLYVSKFFYIANSMRKVPGSKFGTTGSPCKTARKLHCMLLMSSEKKKKWVENY